MPRKKKRKYAQFELFFLITAAVLIIVLWRSPVIFPIKLLSVLIHEIGHALAVIFSGGNVINIEVGANLGGQTFFKGGSAIVVAFAGYLASILFGAAAFFSSYREKERRYFSFALALLLFLFTANFVSEPFSIAVAVIYCIVFTVLPLIKNQFIGEYVMRFVGLTAALYVFTDILQDVFPVNLVLSDAEVLENITGISSIFWGIIWLLIAGFTIYLFFKKAVAHSIKPKR